MTTYPVIEIFGPTIQGEGALAGVPTHFVRFGGCDYRCEWCDSLYAVEPAEVRANAAKLTEEEIVTELLALPGEVGWVTISGGNPALLQLGSVVTGLHEQGWKVAVETQGSLWKDWLWTVEMLTVSPKPPSSGMATRAHDLQTDAFMRKAVELTPDRRALKIVVFDQLDLDWARAVFRARIERGEVWPEFLSVGTDQPDDGDLRLGEPYGSVLEGIGDRYRWLCTEVAGDPLLASCRVLPQLHVLAWAHQRAV